MTLEPNDQAAAGEDDARGEFDQGHSAAALLVALIVGFGGKA